MVGQVVGADCQRAEIKNFSSGYVKFQLPVCEQAAHKYHGVCPAEFSVTYPAAVHGHRPVGGVLVSPKVCWFRIVVYSVETLAELCALKKVKESEYVGTCVKFG